MSWLVHVDGGARGNPGPAGAGIVIARPDGTPALEAGFFLGTQTNNAAEYMGLILALRNLPAEAEDISVIADSELMVKQITGEYRVKSPTLQPLYEQVQMLLVRVPRWKIQHVKRDQNTRADDLANKAMDKRSNVLVTGELRGEGTAASGHQTQVIGSQDEQPAQATSSPPASNSIPTDANQIRIVTVKLIEHPNVEVCPTGGCNAQYQIGSTVPEGLCVHAAHALLTTVIAIQNTEAGDFAAVPPMTVRCSQRECRALFQVSPLLGENGRR
jgi:ribonuclease HI